MSLALNDLPFPQDVWATLTQAERDAAYNNNAAVKNSAELICKRDALASAFRHVHSFHLDIPYGPRARMAYDLFPAPDPRAPCLVFIHGGYWQRNSRELFSHYAEGFAAIGWSVAMPGYSIAPDVSVAQIVEEIGDALDWLVRDGGAHGIAGRIVLSGWSAGAQIAAMLLDHPAVAAGVAISGVYDLEPIRDTFLNGALQLSEDDIMTQSPLRLPPIPKPLLVAYGTAERPALIADSCRLHAKRAAAGAPGPLLAIEGADHFTILDQMRTAEGALVKAARDILLMACPEQTAA